MSITVGGRTGGVDKSDIPLQTVTGEVLCELEIIAGEKVDIHFRS
jgi:hypothetical protein